MNPQAFSEWFSSLSQSERISALAVIYSDLTVGARELFVPEWTAGKEKRVLDLLHGINEIHHSISNQLVQYATDGKYAYSIEGFGQMLAEIVNQYRMGRFLEGSIEFARARIPRRET